MEQQRTEEEQKRADMMEIKARKVEKKLRESMKKDGMTEEQIQAWVDSFL